ncbi:MAG: class D sortase [Chloroflexi bacterium]|nr:class D sortase [Chloroflexota bacterium]
MNAWRRLAKQNQPQHERQQLVVKSLSSLFMVAGILLIGLVAIYYAYSKVAQSRFEGWMNELKPSQNAGSPLVEEPQVFLPTEPAKSPPGQKALPAIRIVISSIGVDAKVVELGTKYENGQLVWETADHAVGHHLGTANPGEIGNIVMSGHISSPVKGEGSVFKRLPEIKLGDEVILYTTVEQFRYQVTNIKVVLPSEVSVMSPTPEPTLTLITCVPDYVYSHRLVVTAKPYP